MTPPTPKDLLSDIEKKTLTQTYYEWHKQLRQNKSLEPSLFRPINVNAYEIVEEMRLLQNSAFKFLPLFMIWHVAELFCTLGTVMKRPALENRGKKILNVLQNFKAIK
jgi:hypothetical protein